MRSISDMPMATEDIHRELEASGLRVTNQRLLVMQIIQQGQGHMDASEIYRQARESNPRLSLSTVYRTLQTLKKYGLIEELHLDEGHHHYEKRSVQHHHLVCLGCGRVVEFRYPLVSLIKKNVKEARNFNIMSSEIRMTGYCPKCR
jgi:Fur family ferric uptake transcriptional regulator